MSRNLHAAPAGGGAGLAGVCGLDVFGFCGVMGGLFFVVCCVEVRVGISRCGDQNPGDFLIFSK